MGCRGTPSQRGVGGRDSSIHLPVPQAVASNTVATRRNLPNGPGVRPVVAGCFTRTVFIFLFSTSADVNTVFLRGFFMPRRQDQKTKINWKTSYTTSTDPCLVVRP